MKATYTAVVPVVEKLCQPPPLSRSEPSTLTPEPAATSPITIQPDGISTSGPKVAANP
jgi:hypothetical protein